MLKIPYEKVFKHPKPIPKPLAEGIGACGFIELYRSILQSHLIQGNSNFSDLTGPHKKIAGQHGEQTNKMANINAAPAPSFKNRPEMMQKHGEASEADSQLVGLTMQDLRGRTARRFTSRQRGHSAESHGLLLQNQRRCQWLECEDPSWIEQIQEVHRCQSSPKTRGQSQRFSEFSYNPPRS